MVRTYLILLILVFSGCKSAEENSTTPSSQQYCGFERPPYILRATLNDGANPLADVLIFGLHAKPDAAWPELNMLDDVIEEISQKENVLNAIALGDFNASCSYLSNTQFNNLDLTIKDFNWIISNNADTNVATSVCAYDRITHKSSFSVATSGVHTATGLISDHYPVYADFVVQDKTFKFSAFNLQRYGETKASDPNFINTVKSFIATKDLVLLQEITTTNNNLINLLVPEGYDVVVSQRLGSSSYKEQYAYVYNSKIDIVKEETYSGSLCTPVYADDSENQSTSESCTSDGYNCGISPYITPAGQCWATKNESKVRTRDCCCGL